jgi:hypothetical protein
MIDQKLIREWITPFSEAVGLPYLPVHFVSLLRSLMLWWSLQLLSHSLSPYLFPRTFSNMSTRTRIHWDLHVVSLIHSAVVAPLITYFWLYMDDKVDRIFGYQYELGQLYALPLGYFVWDVIVSLRYEGPAFILHGVLGLSANILVYKPFLMFQGLSIVMWELSTPFLNIHWFLDKLGLTGSRIQFVNALCLLLTYVIVRMTFGVYASYELISLLWSPSGQNVSMILKWYYSLGLPVLNMLNYMWFFKMLRAMHKRFFAPAKNKSQ